MLAPPSPFEQGEYSYRVGGAECSAEFIEPLLNELLELGERMN